MNQGSFAVPAALAQRRLWFLHHMEPESSLYNLYAAVELSGTVVPRALAGALRRIVQRHEALRTTFATEASQTLQVVHDRLPSALPAVSLVGVASRGREAAVRRLAGAAVRRPFDLRRGPLLRTLLVRLSDRLHVLVVAVHHIVFDGVSLGIFLGELSVLYNSLRAGGEPVLPELPVQYADYSEWQRQQLQEALLEERLRYWRQALAGAPAVLELPTSRPRPAVQTQRGRTVYVSLPPGLASCVAAFGRRHGASTFMVLLAAFQALLSRHSGQPDIVVGTPVANRPRREVRGLIGFFVNSLALRVDLSGDPSFADALARTRENALDAYAHQDLPFDKLVEALKPQRDLSHHPIYQLVFGLNESRFESVRLEGLTASRLSLDSGVAKFDLSLFFDQGPKGLEGHVEYNTDLFDLSAVERLWRHYVVLLEGAAAAPGRRLSALPLLTPAEQQQLVCEWNPRPEVAAAAAAVHRRFERQAAAIPDAVAVVQAGVALSYGETDRRAGDLARRLLVLGAAPDLPIALLAERSPELIVGILAILKAAGAYLPLDPAYPPTRLAWMLEDSGARLLLAQPALRDRLPAGGPVVVDLVAEPSEVPAARPVAVARVGGSNLAYVIFTSGSTGRPKGVMISHRALASYLDTARRVYAIGPGDRVLQFCSISFDISVEEIFPCLTSGGALILRTDEMLNSVAHFLGRAGQLALTVMSLPTAYWHELTAVAMGRDVLLPSSLRLLIIAGERALPERLAGWWQLPPRRPQLINTYGLTEGTIISTAADLSRPDDGPQREVSIGRPVPHATLYLLDRGLSLVAGEVPGEAYIGGPMIARGYIGQPAASAARFLPDPFSVLPGERLYRTGDLARYRADGTLECLGRADHQVKLRGYRIELGEIAARLVDHPQVVEAVVDVPQEAAAPRRLVAYVVPRDGAPTAGELRAFLQQALPDYMIPAAWCFLAELPMTPNGKVDRGRLPAPEGQRPDLGTAHVAPRNGLEEAIAAAWQQVLGIERPGIHDNFFDLGGHSLLMVELQDTLRASLSHEIAIVEMFRYPTIAALARFLADGRDEASLLARTQQRAQQQQRMRGDRFSAARRQLHG